LFQVLVYLFLVQLSNNVSLYSSNDLMKKMYKVSKDYLSSLNLRALNIFSLAHAFFLMTFT